MYAIEVYNLVKEYDGASAVDGITLKVDEGSIFSLLEPNGAGKTTRDTHRVKGPYIRGY